jgi:biotin transport system substrate-specific component
MDWLTGESALERGEGLVAAVSRAAGARAVAERAALVVGFALLTALGAQVRIPLPFTPVPLSLQTFSALLAGLVLGGGLGALSQAIYVVLGTLGAPVFAGGAGTAWLLGRTGGYIMGFVLAALLVGQLSRALDVRQRPWHLLGMLAAGVVVVYVPGVIWLAIVTGIGMGKAVVVGALPFLPGDMLKAFLAVSIWVRLPR